MLVLVLDRRERSGQNPSDHEDPYHLGIRVCWVDHGEVLRSEVLLSRFAG